jgi:hypothetical protein
MELVVGGLDVLNEELLQSHMDLKGDIVELHHHHTYQKVPYFSMFCYAKT